MTEPWRGLSSAISDRYRVERELGAGGMATVWLAHDLRHDRQVAIKVLHPELAAVLGAERFLGEIKTTARLQHPHILPLLDSGEAGGQLYYVMPVVEGESLRARLDRETQLPLADALRIAREVAAALDYAHRHGVIHRDIKPENILLHDGQAMVGDFGIALAVQTAGGERMTQTGLSLGTPQYMSPEQAMGDKNVGARSDVYSLGCVLYEMLAGAPPFTGPTAQAIVAKVITTEAMSITAARGTVPAHVADALRVALQKLPADRFASAAEFAAALDGKAVTAAVHSESATRNRVRAVPLSIVIGSTAAALVLGAIIGRWLGSDEPVRGQVARITMEFPASQAPRSLPFPFPTLALTPDGLGMVYTGPGTGSRTQFWRRNWDVLGGARLPQTSEGACCPVFSPGGDSIAYLSPPHVLRILPLIGGAAVTVADSGVAAMTDFGGGVDWASDGTLVVAGSAGLLRLSPNGGAISRVSDLDARRGDLIHLFPEILPGSRAALVTVVPRAAVNSEALSIGVADFANGEVRIILPGSRAIWSPTGHIVYARANGVLWAAPFDPRSLRVTGPELELPDTAAVGGAGGFGDMAISIDGKLLYRKASISQFEAVWVDRTGASRPVSPELRDQFVDNPMLSPDGRRIAVTMGGQDNVVHLWVKELDGTTRTRITSDGLTNTRGRWRPGTNRLTFTSDRSTPAELFLHEASADGSGQSSKPHLGDSRRIGAHSWSPDGKWLLFRTDDQEAGNGDIMGIRPGVDTVPRALIATPAEELSPEVSPDGRWIAYSSNETGTRQVYVRPFPETNGARTQVSTRGGVNPAWSRSGGELFYIDGDQNMVSVPVTADGSIQSGQSRVLFTVDRFLLNDFGRQFDVHPDGQRFVMVRGESDVNAHIVVVFNFAEDLKRRFANRIPR